jgi:hypothetical protein
MFAAAMESFAHQSGRQGGIQAGAARDGADQGTSDTRRRLTGQTMSLLCEHRSKGFGQPERDHRPDKHPVDATPFQPPMAIPACRGRSVWQSVCGGQLMPSESGLSATNPSWIFAVFRPLRLTGARRDAKPTGARPVEPRVRRWPLLMHPISSALLGRPCLQ